MIYTTLAVGRIQANVTKNFSKTCKSANSWGRLYTNVCCGRSGILLFISIIRFIYYYMYVSCFRKLILLGREHLRSWKRGILMVTYKVYFSQNCLQLKLR